MTQNVIYKPDFNKIYFICIIIAFGILGVIKILADANVILYYMCLAVLTILLIIYINPIIVNQKISISKEQIKIYQYGIENTLHFCKHIDSIITYKNKQISYRFKKDGDYYQISPGAYKNHQELSICFENLLHRCNKQIRHIIK